MVKNILIYWAGILGIAGKGPNWVEPYDPNKTIGEIVQTMVNHKLGESEIFKHEPGNLNKYDRNNPFWPHDTKLSDYINSLGSCVNGKNDVMMTYHIV